MLLLTDSYTQSEEKKKQQQQQQLKHLPAQINQSFLSDSRWKTIVTKSPYPTTSTIVSFWPHGSLLNTGLTLSSGYLFTTSCLDQFKYGPICKLQVCCYLTNSHILEIVSQVDWLHPNQPFPMNSEHFVNKESATRPVSFPSYQVPFGALVFSSQCFVHFGLVLVNALSVLDNGFDLVLFFQNRNLREQKSGISGSCLFGVLLRVSKGTVTPNP